MADVYIIGVSAHFMTSNVNHVLDRSAVTDDHSNS
jgi:hypothetical protein